MTLASLASPQRWFLHRKGNMLSLGKIIFLPPSAIEMAIFYGQRASLPAAAEKAQGERL